MIDCTAALDNIAKSPSSKLDVPQLDCRSIKDLVRHTSKTRDMLVPNIERLKAEGGSTTDGSFFCFVMEYAEEIKTRRKPTDVNDRVHGRRPFRDGRDNQKSTGDLV